MRRLVTDRNLNDADRQSLMQSAFKSKHLRFLREKQDMNDRNCVRPLEVICEDNVTAAMPSVESLPVTRLPSAAELLRTSQGRNTPKH